MICQGHRVVSALLILVRNDPNLLHHDLLVFMGDHNYIDDLFYLLLACHGYAQTPEVEDGRDGSLPLEPMLAWNRF